MSSAIRLPHSSVTLTVYPSSYKPLFGAGGREDLNQEKVRKLTFLFWPAWVPNSISTANLAWLGFYYTGNADEVKCFWCKIVVRGWTEGDDPFQLHLTRSPECQFVKELRGCGDDDDDDDDLGTDGDFVDFSATTRNGKDPFASNGRLESTRTRAKDYGEMFEDGASATVGGQDCVDGASSELRNRARSTTEATVPPSSAAVYVARASVPDAQEVANIDVSRCKSDDPSRSSPSENGDVLRRETRTDANPAVDKTRLKMENEKLRSATTCRKCKKEKIQTLFLPCRHLVTCEECAANMDDCIECKKQILGTVRTFMV